MTHYLDKCVKWNKFWSHQNVEIQQNTTDLQYFEAIFQKLIILRKASQ